MSYEEYTELKKQLDRIEAKVDVTSDLIAIRVISSLGDTWHRHLKRGRQLLRELWEERGVKL